MNGRGLFGVFLLLIPIVALGDRYGVCEGCESGDVGFLMFVMFIALAFGWMLGRELAMLIYGPTLIGMLPLVLLIWMTKGILPWDYSLKRFMAVAVLGYIIGWLIIVWFTREKAEPDK